MMSMGYKETKLKRDMSGGSLRAAAAAAEEEEETETETPQGVR